MYLSEDNGQSLRKCDKDGSFDRSPLGSRAAESQVMLASSKPARIGYGLRERLLLSFIAISGFAVVAAVVGNYAFYAIGEALHQVTEKSVPPAIATLELAQRTERIVAAGPTLLAVTSSEEFKAVSSVLDQELKEAGRLLSELPGQGLTGEKLSEIFGVFDRVTANLETLKSAVQTRIAAADRKSALVRDTFDAYNRFRSIWTSKFDELKGHILTLQGALDAARSTPEDRLAAIDRLNAAFRDLAPLEQNSAGSCERVRGAGPRRRRCHAGRSRSHSHSSRSFGSAHRWSCVRPRSGRSRWR